jgi:DNA-binding MarR family transcriptional regulator
VIAQLSKREGARIEDLISATGWLPHTTRAALTGLRKRGYMIERARSEQGGSLYRIVASPAPALAA